MRRLFITTLILILFFGSTSLAGEPEVDNVTLLREGRFPELEQRFEKYRGENRLNNKGWSWATQTFDILASASKEDSKLQEQLNLWCEHSPNSYLAFTARGYFNREFAWNESAENQKKRKSTEEIREAFYNRLRMAKADLEKAYELDNTAPYAPTTMLHVAASLEKSTEPARKYFDQAVAANPNHFEAYALMFDLLKRKWGGESEEMFKFARDAVAAHPNDPRFGLLIVYAHTEEGIFFRQDEFEYFSDTKVQEEVRGLLLKYMEAYPNSWEGHNELAHFAYLAKDYSLARQQFEIIGEVWTSWTWHNRRSHFEKVRRYVYRKTGSLKYTLYNSIEELWLTISFLAALIPLAWRTLARDKTKYECPQCGEAVITAWKKINLHPIRFIDCPKCRVSISVPAVDYFVRFVPFMATCSFGPLPLLSPHYSINVWLMVTVVIFVFYFMSLKSLRLISTDPATVRRKRKKWIMTAFILALAFFAYALWRNPSILKSGFGTCPLNIKANTQ